MAYVTRCPYCGSVWLMPDKETADRTPVKCPDCNHSFDATCSLTAVPDSLFPGRVPVMLQGSGMPAAAADKKEPFSVIPEIAAEEKPEAAPESTEESAPISLTPRRRHRRPTLPKAPRKRLPRLKVKISPGLRTKPPRKLSRKRHLRPRKKPNPRRVRSLNSPRPSPACRLPSPRPN